MTKEELKPAIVSAAARHGLDPAIVFGVCVQESVLDPHAVRYEPRFKYIQRCPDLKPSHCSVLTEEALQKMSWGIMQVMGAVLREQGYGGWLYLFGTESIDVQLAAGCRHLAMNIKRWGSVEAGIAAYNAGSPRREKSGRYVNQEYVDSVLRHAKAWAS